MTITFPSFLKTKYFSMEIVILMEKEKRAVSYVRIDLRSEPPYIADWRLVKEKLKLLSFALIVLQTQEIKYAS